MSHSGSSTKAEEDQPTVAARVNVALISETVEAMARIQKRSRGLKKVDVVNRAIVLYDFISALLKEPDAELVLRTGDEEQVVKILL